MLALRDLSTVPDNGWKYPHPSGGFIVTFNYGTFYDKIREVYQANGLPAPSEQDIVTWVCTNEWVSCYETESHEPLVNKFFLNMPRPPTACCTSAPLPA